MYDGIIIGAGPAGISMAVELIRAGIAAEKLLVLEKEGDHSFTIRKFYPEQKLVTASWKGIEPVCRGVMCIPDLAKTDTISYLDKAIRDYSIPVRYHEPVSKIEHLGDTFRVVTGCGEYQARVVTIAIGVLGRPKRPDYPLPASVAKKILFDVTSTEVRDSDVLVVGGGDSASEYVQYLSELGNRVTLSYRKKEFNRMNPINRDSLLALEEQGKVVIFRNSDIEQVGDEGERPIVLFRGQTHPSVAFDYIVYALGGTTPRNFLHSIGIDFNEDEPVVMDGYETSIPGLFLLGDLTNIRTGGSIISAFNSARDATHRICSEYLECSIDDEEEAEEGHDADPNDPIFR